MNEFFSQIMVRELPFVPFLECADRLPRPFFLLHSARVQTHHRYSILGIKPLALATCKGKSCSLQISRGNFIEDMDAFAFLEKLANKTKADFAKIGWFAAFSYDLKDQVENLVSTANDGLKLPELFAVLCREYYLFDELEQTCFHFTLQSELADLNYAAVKGDGHNNLAWQAEWSREKFLQAVNQVKQHIAAGDIYQANLAQRFSASTFADLWAFYKKMVERNPAPMQAFFEFPQASLLSTSPERFLKRVDSMVSTRPIKGTRPRSKDEVEDHKLYEELKSSAKDAAELAMIIDLMRNDLGKHAQVGSVQVTEKQSIETYQNVFQQVAQVEAKVSKNISSLELIKSCFPAGSITGCPKKRAMEVIEELEVIKRNFYCGSLGVLEFNGDFDLNVAIRTLVATHEKMYFSVGSGIVFDSDPEAEYEETLAKGKTFFEVLSDG